jgi:hypothetical protein
MDCRCATKLPLIWIYRSTRGFTICPKRCPSWPVSRLWQHNFQPWLGTTLTSSCQCILSPCGSVSYVRIKTQKLFPQLAIYVLHIYSRVYTRLALACSARRGWCRTQAYYWASTDGHSMQGWQESQLIVVCTRSRYTLCKIALRLVARQCKLERRLNI